MTVIAYTSLSSIVSATSFPNSFSYRLNSPLNLPFTVTAKATLKPTEISLGYPPIVPDVFNLYHKHRAK